MPTIVRSPNRAGEPEVEARVKTDLAPLIPRIRDDKAQLHTIAMRHWNIWAARHDSAAYKGRLRAYLTTGRRVIENWVSMLKRSAFPVSGKWYEVNARTKESEDRAPTVQSLFHRELTEYMAIRRKASPMLRGLVVLGTQPVDLGWRVSTREIPTFEEIASGGPSGRVLEERIKRVVEYLGPTLRPVDFFRFYVWPTTVNDLGDAELCFEDFLQAPGELERLSRSPIVPGLEKGKKANKLGFHIDPTQWAKAKDLLPRGEGASDKWTEQRRRLGARGFHAPMDLGAVASEMLDCVKGYWHVQLPGDEAASWYEFILAGDDIPLRVRQVSKLRGNPSYLTPKFCEVWEEFWGYGLPHAFESVHHFLNDVFNQGGDALTWSLNPIAAIDPDAFQDHTSIQMKPGAKWLVRMPRQSIAWMEPPKESGQVALAAVSQLVGLINDVGGVQPFAPGGKTTGKGRSVDTLGGLQILASEGQLQIADVIQNMEDTFFNPLLRAMYDLNVQCLDEPMLLNVEGVRGAALIQTNVTRAHLIGEFDMRWLASTYQYNQEVRTMQMNGMLQIVSRIPPELLAQDNTRFRIGEFLRIMYTEGLLLPHPQRVFQDASPVRAIDPELENELFRQGRGDEVTVSPADKHEEHFAKHLALAADPTLPPPVKELLMVHVQQTVLAITAVQMMLAEKAAMAQAGGGAGPVGLPPPGGGNGSDRLAMPDAPGRQSATSSMDDVARRMPRPGGQGPGGFPNG